MSARVTGYQSYLRSEHWANLRLEKFVKSGMRCHFCQVESLSNDVHHVKYPKNLKDTKVKHLRVLCRTCHEMVHEILKEYPAINKDESTRARWRIVVQHMNRRLGFKMCFQRDEDDLYYVKQHALSMASLRLKAARKYMAKVLGCNILKREAPVTDEFAEWLFDHPDTSDITALLMASVLAKTGLTRAKLRRRTSFRTKWSKKRRARFLHDEKRKDLARGLGYNREAHYDRLAEILAAERARFLNGRISVLLNEMEAGALAKN